MKSTSSSLSIWFLRSWRFQSHNCLTYFPIIHRRDPETSAGPCRGEPHCTLSRTCSGKSDHHRTGDALRCVTVRDSRTALFWDWKNLTFSGENWWTPSNNFLKFAESSCTLLKTSGHENIWERSRFIALRWVIDRYRVGFVRRRFSWILSRLKENVTKREKTDFSEEKYIKNRQNCSSQFRVSHFIWFLGQVCVFKMGKWVKNQN